MGQMTTHWNVQDQVNSHAEQQLTQCRMPKIVLRRVVGVGEISGALKPSTLGGMGRCNKEASKSWGLSNVD
ncbi:hypothetical protein FQN51_007985 [Onygenales sp. PD_10]|nr:hypothetical protein FQN51_007985 [Onygenales sp. PD_10]